MSHGITDNDNMFSVKERPWHKLGTVLETAPSIEEGIKLAGLSWEVGLKKLYAPTNEKGDSMEEVDARAIYRKDTNKILGVTGTQYKPLQNIEAFNFFQPFLDSELATLETAGSLFEGKKVFVLAKINLPAFTIVKKSDDKVESFVLLSNSHDGKQSVKVGFTPVRVVCNNTLTMAHNSKKSKLIRIKHSSNVVQNLENLRETMNLITNEFEATAEQFKRLATIDVNQNDVKKYFKEVFNLKEDEEYNKKQRTMETLLELFETGRGNHLPGVQGTSWAAYNAVTEYLQYYSGRTLENRMGNLWLGPNADKNKKALELALTL